MDTSFVRKHWTKIKGYYLLVRTEGKWPNVRHIYAKTRSTETAEKLRRAGFKSVEGAWKLYRKSLAGFDLY